MYSTLLLAAFLVDDGDHLFNIVTTQLTLGSRKAQRGKHALNGPCPLPTFTETRRERIATVSSYRTEMKKKAKGLEGA